ncbi:hypothetical protein GCM10009413_12880 [Tatumella punctata]
MSGQANINNLFTRRYYTYLNNHLYGALRNFSLSYQPLPPESGDNPSLKGKYLRCMLLQKLDKFPGCP